MQVEMIVTRKVSIVKDKQSEFMLELERPHDTYEGDPWTVQLFVTVEEWLEYKQGDRVSLSLNTFEINEG